MKRCIFFILAALFLFINCLPSSIVFGDDSSYSSSQYADVGTLMLTSLISSGEATELDFSDYTQNDGLDFLVALGELAVTGDPSGLIDQGLTWLGGELDDAYQSLIEDIRAWEHDIAPDLYNWWYNGSKYEYKLQPTTNISRPLTNLLRAPDDSDPNPEPLPDFSFLSNTVDFTWYNTNTLTVNSGKLIKCDNYTVYATPANCSFLANAERSDFANTPLCISNLISIYITDTGSNITVTYANKSPSFAPVPGYPNDYAYSVSAFGENSTYLLCQSPDWYPRTYFNKRTSFDSLSVCCNYIYDNFRHVNIYYNGEPWVIVSQNTPTYPIVIPGTLTVLNNQPAIYTFNDPTYYDLNNLKTLITNAINSSDVLTWQDIDDYFLDINGQQAFPVVQIYRNDYDNMYIEQYPYPAKLIGMQDPLTFNEHLLDNYYGQYLTPMIDVASNTIDVLPGEIKWVLGIGAILMIFAVIINRLLE